MTNEEIVRAAEAKGLTVDPERFLAGLNSLLARCRRLGDLLPRESTPPPNQAPR